MNSESGTRWAAFRAREEQDLESPIHTVSWDASLVAPQIGILCCGPASHAYSCCLSS